MVGVAFDALGDGDKKLPFQGRRSRRQNRPPATTATLLANLSPLHENGQQKIPVPGPDLYMQQTSSTLKTLALRICKGTENNLHEKMGILFIHANRYTRIV